MSSAQQFFQRFILIYLVLYIYPYGFEYIMELKPDDISFWTPITTWFGETFLGWEFNPKRLMKGFDSKYDYSRFLLIGILSFLLALIWGLLKGRFQRIRVKTWIITILRYHVGLTMILYGLSKVLVLQFGEMDLLNLENKMGSYTGMGFLWRFMSYSPFYTQVTGYVEVIGGILLLFRGTTFLGSLISFIAMVNVVVIDIGYDVSVKMFAIHLLLMVFVLVAYNTRRILQFSLNRTHIVPVKYESLIPSRYRKLQYGLKAAILIYFTISQFYFQGKRIDRRNTENEAPSLSSVYFVKDQTANGIPLSDDEFPQELKWETLFINGSSYLKNSMVIENAKGNRRYFSTKTDTINKTITFYPLRGSGEESNTFTYQKLDGKQVRFEGIYQGDTLSITTESKAKEDYRLMNNKIKWIRDLE